MPDSPADRTRSLVLIALFSALTAIGAFVRVPLPTPVPFTLQVPAVLLAGLLLGPGRGAASQLAYLAAGLVGLPVFAEGGGPAYFMKPTFGFLVGFVAGAAVTGVVAGDPARCGTKRAALALACGIAAIYLVGVPWLGWNLAYVQQRPAAAALAKMAYVFFPLDLLKVALLIPVARAVRARGGLPGSPVR